MKYIRDIKTDSIEEMVKTYGISIDLDPTDSYSVARSVYDACEKFIPQNLIGIFTKLGKRKEFEEDIIQHLMFNTHMVSRQKKNEFVESNHNECKKTVEELENNDFSNTRSISNYIKVLNNKIGDYFHLEKVLEDNKSFNKRNNKKIEVVKVPVFAAPFIFYTIVNYDFHQDFMESKLPSWGLETIK